MGLVASGIMSLPHVRGRYQEQRLAYLGGYLRCIIVSETEVQQFILLAHAEHNKHTPSFRTQSLNRADPSVSLSYLFMCCMFI